MTTTIYKYELPDDLILEMPKGAEVLTVQMQRGSPCLWARVDPEEQVEKRKFVIHGTGHPVPSSTGKYIATFQVDDETLVFHVFESHSKPH